VRIDLKEPGIRFLVTPPNGSEPLETNGRKTASFLTAYGCQVAINASPFKPIVSSEGKPQDVLGLSISQGDRYSEAAAGYGALLISKSNEARIAVPPFAAKTAYNAVGGFRVILKDGENVGREGLVHPRSAAGIAEDGRYLYLVAIDGRQPGYSEGTTTAETAEWMRRFGCHQAVNLDGGGSTTLVVSNGRGGARLLNRPIHLGIPGVQRVTANHLGVFAEPLKE
jgi:exopolysaccharide biosynthesis protein